MAICWLEMCKWPFAGCCSMDGNVHMAICQMLRYGWKCADGHWVDVVDLSSYNGYCTVVLLNLMYIVTLLEYAWFSHHA
jgi:hypothetical protein